jgi:hypothetical protein
VYALEQLEDAVRIEMRIFRRAWLTFSASNNPCPGHEKSNHFTGAAAHPETIDICESSFQRAANGERRNRICAMDWKRFINAADVTVSNRDHFLRH